MTKAKVNIDFLIIIPPERDFPTAYPPYGAMYICSALRRHGYTCAILNLDVERLEFEQTIKRVIDIDPRYIGFSGIVSTSYAFIKRLSLALRGALRNRKQILGGGLSAAWETVLKHTAVDVIVLGEGDETIVDLLEHIDSGNDLSSINGIAYRASGRMEKTKRRRLISPLDKLPYPEFDAVDMDQYLIDGIKFIKGFSNKIHDPRFYEKKRKNKRMITIPVSRGCFGRCTFCYRAYPGLRTHSPGYIFDFVEYCISKFDVGFFTFGDECFAPNIEWNWKFLNELKKRRIDIIFRILGMRVDTVNPEILAAYKQAGCWMIEYGFESGSQKMLNIMDKRVTVKQNRNAANWTREAGIHTFPTLVLGMPGETNDTIAESIAFIKSLNLNYKQYQMTYAMPIPGAPLYEYAKLQGIISDEDAYLEKISGKTAVGMTCNLTREMDEVVRSWMGRIKNEIDANFFARKLRSRILGKLTVIILGKLFALKYLYSRSLLSRTFKNKLKNFRNAMFRKTESKQRYQKRILNLPDIDEIFSDVDHNWSHRNVSLREYNQQVRILNDGVDVKQSL